MQKRVCGSARACAVRTYVSRVVDVHAREQRVWRANNSATKIVTVGGAEIRKVVKRYGINL